MIRASVCLNKSAGHQNSAVIQLATQAWPKDDRQQDTTSIGGKLFDIMCNFVSNCWLCQNFWHLMLGSVKYIVGCSHFKVASGGLHIKCFSCSLDFWEKMLRKNSCTFSSRIWLHGSNFRFFRGFFQVFPFSKDRFVLILFWFFDGLKFPRIKQNFLKY